MHLDNFDDLYTIDESVQSFECDTAGVAGVFETYGEDIEHVLQVFAKTPARVWTLIDGEQGETLLVNGLLYVNRINYMVTVECGNGETFVI